MTITKGLSGNALNINPSIHPNKKDFSEISEKVGFPDYNYFSRVFKKYKAVTPTKFRKSLSDSRDIRA